LLQALHPVENHVIDECDLTSALAEIDPALKFVDNLQFLDVSLFDVCNGYKRAYTEGKAKMPRKSELVCTPTARIFYYFRSVYVPAG